MSRRLSLIFTTVAGISTNKISKLNSEAFLMTSAFQEQAVRGGECIRLPPMWPGSDSYLDALWELRLFLLFCAPGGLPSTLVFPLLLKKIDLNCWD